VVAPATGTYDVLGGGGHVRTFESRQRVGVCADRLTGRHIRERYRGRIAYSERNITHDNHGTIVERPAYACPTPWCGLLNGHDTAGHRSTVTTAEGQIGVEIEVFEDDATRLINVAIPGKGLLDDLTSERARTTGSFLGAALKVTAFNRASVGP
jgi:hypothetical protein